MATIKTNRDLYLAIGSLVESQKASTRSLEEYLRALWMAARKFRDRSSLKTNEFFDLLSSAFTFPAPGFCEDWRSHFEEDSKDLPGFEGWEACVVRQIVDLREMWEQKHFENENRYLGLNSPRGCTWYNFDPCTFLECATAGSFGWWRQGVAVLGDDRQIRIIKPQDVAIPAVPISAISWEKFRWFLIDGQSYE